MNPVPAFLFGPFTLIPARQLLLRDDVPVRIGGRALDILTALVEQPGAMLSKTVLIARVWPTTVVDEGSLKVNVAGLRRALGDGNYIATVPGCGYRFVAPVTTSAASTCAAATRRHNLPFGTVHIIGRAEAIPAIRDQLRGARLLSIVGPGGVGKTTVALAVAEEAIGRADGVWLVDLAPLKEAALLPNAIATALGLAAHAPDMLAALCDYLRKRRMLIVLDSCEHMVDAIAACANCILAAAPDVKILATSREPLRVKGERVHRLPGLGLPPPSPGLTAQEALAFPAIQLFTLRATDRVESFILRDADAAIVADICHRLDGLALAIELAATRIDAFGVRGLRDQLASHFSLPEGRRAGPERHRTLHATIAWSYDLLSGSERMLMRRLAVFAGTFSLESACAVGAEDGVAEDLARLIDKSLVAASVRDSVADYRLLDTTRAYCLQRLKCSGEDQAVWQRHAEHVCAVLERAALEWAERPAREWGAAYSPFIDDLRAALGWTGRAALHLHLRIRLTVAGTLLWNHFSLTDECRGHVALAVGELDVAGLAGGFSEMQLQWALAGAAMFTRGLMPEVIDALQRGLAIAVQIGDMDHRLRCLRMIGVYELFSGQYAAAMRTLDHFVAVATVADCAAVPEGESHLGAGEFLVGRLHAARQRLERLYAHNLQDIEDARFMRFLYARNVDVGNVLSNVLWLIGDCHAGEALAAANVELACKTGHGLSLSNALAFALPVFYLSGRHEECRAYLAMLDEQVMRNGIVTWRPLVLFYRGALATIPADGIADLERAVAELDAIRHFVRMPFYLAVLADALARSGRLADATFTIAAAIAYGEEQNEQWCQPEVLRIHAAILVASGRLDDAAAALGASIAMADGTGAVSWRLRSAADLAELERARV